MKKKLCKVILIGFSILFFSFILVSMFIGQQVFSATTQLVTNDTTKGFPHKLFQQFDFEQFKQSYNIERISIQSSFDDHMIPADYMYANDSDNKNSPTVILVHGLEDNRYTNYPWAQFFLEKGYNVITYDQRSSNENMAKSTTFGYWEKYDLIDWINYVRESAPDHELGVWSVSNGGATAGLALGHENTAEKVDFLILESPISSMEWMVEEEIRNMDIPIPTSYVIWCGNIMNKLQLGFSYEDADVVKAMHEIKTPILVINSKGDSLTPYFMGKAIYETVQSKNKEIWTVDHSEHFEIWTDYNEEYRKKMILFLEKS